MYLIYDTMTSLAETVQRLRQHQPPSSYNLTPIYIHLTQKKLTVLEAWSLKMEKKSHAKHVFLTLEDIYTISNGLCSKDLWPAPY